jgi:hypothetical protein
MEFLLRLPVAVFAIQTHTQQISLRRVRLLILSEQGFDDAR